jgi:AcrR family transcriptional regulator
MSPRPYRLGQRQAAVEQTRARILTAARELLTASGGIAGFTVDAVARQAGVARMTVYYQFGSKVGLLEALCDVLAARGLGERMCGVFGKAEPLETLDELIAVFGGFWESDRLVLRRLRALAALDPDIEQVIRARDERRREALRGIVQRLAHTHSRPAAKARAEAVDVLHVLTSLETFDSLAGPERSTEEVVPLVRRLARAALGLEGE